MKNLRYFIGAGILLALLIISFFVFRLIIFKKEKLNVIFISIETTRADHLSCYGYRRNTSPALDKLAEEGVLFSNMFVQRGQTWPSLTSIMTSLYPVNHNVRRNGDLLSPSKISLAEILKNHGYVCGAFLTCAHDAVWRGFDKKYHTRGNDKKITSRAIKWLTKTKRNNQKPIFLWIHYWQPHKPYMPPARYSFIFDPKYKGIYNGSTEQLNEIILNKIQLNESDLNHIISLYDGSILLIDDQIKRVLDTLELLEIEEDTLFIVTSDHGEDLYDHNCYFYHSASIYDSSLHVPLIIRLPKKNQQNKKVSEIVESIDIAPTILDVLNLPIPSYFEGKSLTPLIFSKKTQGFSFAYSEIEDKILSIRTQKYRYIYNPENYHPLPLNESTKEDYPIDKEELYDSINDPNESSNVVSEYREIALSLKERILSWENFQLWKKGYKRQKIKKHIEKRLKALGYIH